MENDGIERGDLIGCFRKKILIGIVVEFFI